MPARGGGEAKKALEAYVWTGEVGGVAGGVYSDTLLRCQSRALENVCGRGRLEGASWGGVRGPQSSSVGRGVRRERLGPLSRRGAVLA